MIFRDLYEHLLRHEQLQLPGIGCLRLHRRPAEVDFRNRQVQAPVYSIQLDPEDESASARDLAAPLSETLGLTADEALQKFSELCRGLRQRLVKGGSFQWNGVGVFRLDDAGKISLDPVGSDPELFSPVPAERIVRQDAEHLVTVGEQSRTSTEMSRMLAQTDIPGRKAVRWWLLPLIVGLAASAFVAWYSLKQGSAMSVVSNKASLSVRESEPTYRIIP